jgi:hypothetical protein
MLARPGKELGSVMGDACICKSKVFVSFDFDNDKVLKDFIIGQAKLPDSPFAVASADLQRDIPAPTLEFWRA